MRGGDARTEGLFSYVSCEKRVPAGHPLRPIRAIVDEALEVLSPEFSALYSKVGRPSIPPEKLLRALLLQAFYTIRSERQLMEQLDYNLLFRWFVGLSMDAPVWDVTVFTKNRERLLTGAVAGKFLAAVVAQARGRDLLSDAHFSVDGAPIEAWASLKSFRPKDGGGEPAGPQRGARLPRRDAVQRDPCLDRRSGRPPVPQEQRPVGAHGLYGPRADGEPQRPRPFSGHLYALKALCVQSPRRLPPRGRRPALAGWRNPGGSIYSDCALVVAARLTQATGGAEREAALALPDGYRPLGEKGGRRRIAPGADKAYDVTAFVDAPRGRRVTPRIAVDGHVTETGKRRKTRTREPSASAGCSP